MVICQEKLRRNTSWSERSPRMSRRRLSAFSPPLSPSSPLPLPAPARARDGCMVHVLSRVRKGRNAPPDTGCGRGDCGEEKRRRERGEETKE